ncbi:hypothetical protein BHE74_00015762 [Ensete ventricosum]|nr:hypothetical protein BHE74_00015762 [Ensete ventricosum]
MNREARWEHAGRSLEEDRKTRRKNVGGCRISRKILAVVPPVSGSCTVMHRNPGSRRRLYHPSQRLYYRHLGFQAAIDGWTVQADDYTAHTLFSG